MRYLEVGGNYKRPRFPIWIIGSTSHFTVLFGSEATAIQESSSDALLEKVRRTFKGMGSAAEENGFLPTSQLRSFLKKVGLQRLTEHEIQLLAATIEVCGAGIILWEELWKKTSRLLSGASIESVLQDCGNNCHGGGKTSPLPLLDPDAASAASSFDTAAATMSDSPMSDEELARLLQTELNRGVIDLTGLHDNNSNKANFAAAAESTTAMASDAATASPADVANLDTFESKNHVQLQYQYGHTFQLYHYNGLRGGNFQPFRVTRLNADEAIGASIPLGVSHSTSLAGVGLDLEDVLRTKW
jgi:ubiquitin carboxyl-terminal hydrolase MINDY-3/4